MSDDTTQNPDDPVTPEWTVLDIISRHRETEGVFKNLEVETGRCICCEGLFLPLRDAAREFGFDEATAMNRIRQTIHTMTGTKK